MKLKDSVLGNIFSPIVLLVYLFIPFSSLYCSWYAELIIFFSYFCTTDINDGSASANADGFRAVPYSYGSSSDFGDQKTADMESGFNPPFPVPDYLLQHLVSYCFGRLFPLEICGLWSLIWY